MNKVIRKIGGKNRVIYLTHEEELEICKNYLYLYGNPFPDNTLKPFRVVKSGEGDKVQGGQ